MTVQEQTTIDTIRESGIFDIGHYTQQAQKTFSTVENAIAHFLAEGASMHLNPHPLFNTSFYLEKNPDVATAGVNPLLHYISQGGLENRQPSEEFDGPFYLRNHADVKASRENPLSHFILRGAAEGRKPNAIFDPAYYTAQNQDVKSSGVNPLVHYVLHGKEEGRKPNSRPQYPRDLYLQMRKLEPLLPPFEELQFLRESKESGPSRAGAVYDRLKLEVTRRFTHLYVVANTEQSIATTSSLLETLAKSGNSNHALVVFTGRDQTSNSQARSELKRTATVVSLQGYGQKLEPEEELLVLSRLAIQAKPHVVHAIDSRVCLNLFRRMHRPLSLNSKLFASAHPFMVDTEGVYSGPNLYLSPCADALTAVLVSSEETREQLIAQIGFEPEAAQRCVVLANGDFRLQQLKNYSYFSE